MDERAGFVAHCIAPDRGKGQPRWFSSTSSRLLEVPRSGKCRQADALSKTETSGSLYWGQGEQLSSETVAKIKAGVVESFFVCQIR
jgi:hypothetical protein